MNSPVLVKERSGRALPQAMLINGHRHPSILRLALRMACRTLKALAKGVAEARRMVRAHNELAAMSDPELRDIGINRSDISAVVSGRYPTDHFSFLINPQAGEKSRGMHDVQHAEREACAND
jgi:uncharacterized protein YjiS (DUF1127 family)